MQASSQMGSTKRSTVGHAADSNAQDDGEHVPPLAWLELATEKETLRRADQLHKEY